LHPTPSDGVWAPREQGIPRTSCTVPTQSKCSRFVEWMGVC
jgi:hypothetical protein